MGKSAAMPKAKANAKANAKTRKSARADGKLSSMTSDVNNLRTKIRQKGSTGADERELARLLDLRSKHKEIHT